MEKLNSGTSGSGGIVDTDPPKSEDDEASNKLEERVGVGSGVKKVGGSGTSTEGNQNTSSSSDTEPESVGSETTGASSASGPATNDEPAVTTPGGGEAVQPGGGQSGGSRETSSSTTGTGATDRGGRDLDPLEVEEAASDSGAGAGTDAGAGGSGSTSTPATDAPDMIGAGGQQRSGAQPSSRNADPEDSISERRKSEIKGQVILNNPELFDTGPGDDDGGRFDSGDIVVSRSDDGQITAEISESARREVARENYISALARGDAADELDSPGATVERTDAAAQREENRELVRERFQSGEFDESDVAVEETDAGTVARLSEDAQRELVLDRVVEKSPSVGPDAPLGREDVIVRENDDGQLTAMIAPGAAQRSSANGAQFGDMTATGLDIDNSPTGTALADGVASGRSPGLSAGGQRSGDEGEQFGDIDWSSGFDAVEARTGVDVPFGGNPNRDEVEEAIDGRSTEIAQSIREFSDQQAQDIAGDAPQRSAPGTLSPVGFAAPGRVSRVSSQFVDSGADLTADLVRAPSAALEGAELGGYLLGGTVVAGGSPEEFNERAGEVGEAGVEVGQAAATNVRQNPRSATSDLLVGLALGAGVSRGVRLATRGVPDSPDAPDTSSPDRTLDLSSPTQRARNRASRVRSRVSEARERSPDVAVRFDSDSGLVEVDPFLKQQLREGITGRSRFIDGLQNPRGFTARQLGRKSRLAQERARRAAVEARTGAEVAARSRLADLPSRDSVRGIVPDRPDVGLRNPTDMSARELGRESRLAEARVRNEFSSALTGAEIAARSRLGSLSPDFGTDFTARQLGRESRLVQARISNTASSARTALELAARSRADSLTPDFGFRNPSGMSARQLGRESRLAEARFRNAAGSARTGAELAVRSRLADLPSRDSIGGAFPDSPTFDFSNPSDMSARQLGRESRLVQARVGNSLNDARTGAELAVRSRLADTPSVDLGALTPAFGGSGGFESPTLTIGPIRPARTTFEFVDSADDAARGANRAVDDDDVFTPVESDSDGSNAGSNQIDTDVRNTRSGDTQNQQTVARLQQLEPDSRPRADIDDGLVDGRTLADAGLVGSLGNAPLGELDEGTGAVSEPGSVEVDPTATGVDTDAATEPQLEVDPGTTNDVGVRTPTDTNTGIEPDQQNRVGVGLGVIQAEATDTQLETVPEQTQEGPATPALGTPGTSRPRFDFGPGGAGVDSESDDPSPGFSPLDEDDGQLGVGWLSETQTTIATRGLESTGAPSQDTLEERPGAEQLLGELPTQQQLEGGESIEEVSELFGGYGVAGDGDDDGENPFFADGDDDGVFSFNL